MNTRKREAASRPSEALRWPRTAEPIAVRVLEPGDFEAI
jgi:hypothetical protein